MLKRLLAFTAVALPLFAADLSGIWTGQLTDKNGDPHDLAFQLIGRLKEMINRGGEKISPAELDLVLLTHPAVTEAVCFGFAHPSWGEEVAAAVVLKEPATEADLLAFCKERVAEFKRPKKIHIVETIPRTATGKIQRRAVAQAFA